MAKSEYDVRVVPSVLDRLIDDDPKTLRDSIPSRSDTVREFRRAVQRDLENLLNTRNPHFDLPPEFAEVGQSAVAYGLSDFSALNVGNASDQQRLRHFVENALHSFEPR